ncbi:MAG: RecQ family ATP-dependent DNA helicase [Treponema sp.]|jgi:ATP-dependent DNA helicase RecQ|nr:RecQ family ATP-dependent DNA helicase [Treponema sp.]
MAEQTTDSTDPLSSAVQALFGLSYLFPYQRLVVANILEAATAAGIPLHWPSMDAIETLAETVTGAESAKPTELAEPAESDDGPSDRECLGRQIVILPTGAGKSLCFQLPAMIMEGPTLVIYPILSLMADQERRLRERGFSPVILRGGQSAEEREEIWKKLRSGESKFIIANPEVLLTPQVKSQFEHIKVVHIVIDEAHCVSEWGESFRPSYLEIHTIIKMLNAPLVTAFTATASAPVLEKIQKYIFGDLDAHQIVGNPDRANITYTAQGCIVRDMAVRDMLIQNSRPAIVFCSSRPGTEKLAAYLRNELSDMGMNWHNEIRFYHAGLEREEKTVVEKWFLHNSEAVLVATCAFGMGVDKADVRTVIHRDCPPSVEAYLQESGRAGRDGAQSKAILLWGPDDEGILRRAKTETDRKRLSGLLDYARDVTGCRRQALLKMLDYDSNGECPQTPCCDVCEKQARTALREEEAVCDFFRRNKRRYTINEAAGVLARTETVHWSEGESVQTILYLVKTGKLKKTRNIFWKNNITTGK